jgi:hypothetical protein
LQTFKLDKPRNLAFTICSINYLAQAVTLGDSLKLSNSEVIFRIYLVDKLEGREEIKELVPYTLIEIENVPVTDFEGMCERYNLIELNTAVKPFIIDHIFNTDKSIKNIIYFDPDIMVFENLDQIFQNLISSSIILTPHILTPSEEHPYGQAEKNYLLAGVFHFGFIAVSRKSETTRFLTWWKNRLVYQAYSDTVTHYFYDQKWLNFAPVFFEKVLIEKSPGYNMAGWNLHEREITSTDYGRYIVNFYFPLVFFHFSGVKISDTKISSYTNYTFDQRPDLVEIIKEYKKKVIKNGSEHFIAHKCYYSRYYRGIIIYYPKYHWITLYRRLRVKLGGVKRSLLFLTKGLNL